MTPRTQPTKPMTPTYRAHAQDTLNPAEEFWRDECTRWDRLETEWEAARRVCERAELLFLLGAVSAGAISLALFLSIPV